MLLHPTFSEPTQLGGLSAAIWEVLDHPCTAGELVEELQPLGPLHQDIEEALQLLCRHGFALELEA